MVSGWSDAICEKGWSGKAAALCLGGDEMILRGDGKGVGVTASGEESCRRSKYKC